MKPATIKIANDLIKRIQEDCYKHKGKPYILPSGRMVCNKCGKEWRDRDEQ